MSFWMSQNLTIGLGLTLVVKLKVTSLFFSSSSSSDRVIVGSARIRIPDLEGAPLDTFSRDRDCQLEQISLESFNHPDASQYKTAQFYRVMNTPETEIRAAGECRR